MIGSACLLEAQPGPAAAWLVLLGWAAVCAGGRRPAREIATRELRSEWSISKPARALRTLRRPPHRRRLRCCPGPAAPAGHAAASNRVGLVVCVLPRPCHRPRAPRQVPPDPPVPSTRAVLCNFACNSPDCISDLVIESLIFCGFWACVDSCTGGIACEICESATRLSAVGPASVGPLLGYRRASFRRD